MIGGPEFPVALGRVFILKISFHSPTAKLKEDAQFWKREESSEEVSERKG